LINTTSELLFKVDKYMQGGEAKNNIFDRYKVEATCSKLPAHDIKQLFEKRKKDYCTYL